MTDIEAPNGRSGTEPRRALVVAADAATLAACRAAMRQGWHIEVVDSGVDAVIAARRSVPAVIFIDLQLRDVPGTEAVSWLRSNPAVSGVPIVLIAGGAEDDEEIAKVRPWALIRKPVSRGAVERVAVRLSAVVAAGQLAGDVG